MKQAWIGYRALKAPACGARNNHALTLSDAMDKYYSHTLAAEKLKRCYRTAPSRIKQYLAAEIEHVAAMMRPSWKILELGCGYGRILGALAGTARQSVGIDISRASLKAAAADLGHYDNICLGAMDAGRLALANRRFDLVLALQNGLSAMKVDHDRLIAEAVRVTAPGGKIILSSYAEKFWEVRLDWFHRQAAMGLIGEIDHERTGRGVIVCRDGFRATTVTPGEFRRLADRHRLRADIYEIDGSSVFCVITA